MSRWRRSALACRPPGPGQEVRAFRSRAVRARPISSPRPWGNSWVARRVATVVRIREGSGGHWVGSERGSGGDRRYGSTSPSPKPIPAYGAAGACSLNDRLQQLDPALDTRCTGQPGIGGQQGSGGDLFRQRDVGGVVAAQIVPQGPHPRPKPVGGKSCDRQTAEALHHEVALLCGEHLAVDKAAQYMRDLTVDQMGRRELFFAQKVRIKVAGKQFDDDASVHDPHSPRPSSSTDRIVLRSAGPWTFS